MWPEIMAGWHKGKERRKTEGRLLRSDGKFGVGFGFCGAPSEGSPAMAKRSWGWSVVKGEKWGEWGRRREAAGGLGWWFHGAALVGVFDGVSVVCGERRDERRGLEGDLVRVGGFPAIVGVVHQSSWKEKGESGAARNRERKKKRGKGKRVAAVA
ncbi:hypothetical protein HAX54_038138 [Datura stramonium]|uniref:Uncharacterized protein n=1 Tax=Datura stramonium TaxID=4076 RepID=A0ABS8Y627_DATST|nr:hypothetical protein [Datura stramonium]